MKNTISINSSASQSSKIYPSYTCDETASKEVKSIVENHNQYRAEVEVTEFNSEFSRNVWYAILNSGRKNLANKYASDVPAHQRLSLYNGKTKAQTEIEIAENSDVYGGKFLKSQTEEGKKAFLEYKLNHAKNLIRAYGLENELSKIPDFEFPRFGNVYGTMTTNEWWEAAIKEILSLIGESGWVEINGQKIIP